MYNYKTTHHDKFDSKRKKTAKIKSASAPYLKQQYF